MNIGDQIKEIQNNKENGVKILLQQDQEILADVLLSSSERSPFTSGLQLDQVGVTLSDIGAIEVDKNFQTKIPNIYAIGDVIGAPFLASKAEEQGIQAVMFMNNKLAQAS
jgi:pyruvate/2-oxoglutarate dehydrogenase complex dihydrolipoamide dehydrogenase (E3) component